MAKVNMKGMDVYLRQLQDLAADTDSMCKMAVYEGTRVVADAVRDGIKTIPDQTRPPQKEDGYIYKGLYPDQKKGLEEGLGISPITKEDGAWSARVGFEGYNGHKTKKYPQGQPNQMIAASTERGTIYRQKTPFIRDAVKKCRKEAEQAMALCVESEIAKKIND